MVIDVYDALALLGLGMLGTGLWLVSPALSLSVVGALLLGFGLVGAAWRARRGRRP